MRNIWRILVFGFWLAATGSKSLADDAVYLPAAAWPVMRGDLRNSGSAQPANRAIPPASSGELRSFRTGNGIFSTPVIDDRDRVYVGSADHYFYALDPVSGKELWRFPTGEIIDSAAALGKDGTIYFPSGDSRLYALSREGRELWAFDALKDRPARLFSLSTNYWWEGNVVIGPDGALYAGNDDFYFYCIEPDGKMRWAYYTGFFIWSAAAFDDAGTVYFPSFDMKLYALDSKTGKLKWKKDLGAPLVGSPAIAGDGTIYQSGMDGKLYALDSSRGVVKWSFQTGDHIYASPALADDAVYIASADGFLYALTPADGKPKWTFYTGDALRSSPALGPDPEAKSPYLIYFGGGDGSVYALTPEGKRRWSYDTLFGAGEVDYPSINASPALGKTGLAVATSNGSVVWIPYDYYLRKNAKGINRDPTEGFASRGAAWHLVTPGGLVINAPLPKEWESSLLPEMGPATVLSLRMVVIHGSKVVDARIIPGSVKLRASPEFEFRAEFLGDQKTVNVVPREILKPSSNYAIDIAAVYRTAEGKTGEAKGALSFSTGMSASQGVLSGGKFPGFVISHMAIPQPAIIPSLDQIGIASTTMPLVILEQDPAKKTFVAWSVQRFGETETGELVGVPDSRSLLYAFAGKWENDSFIMTAENVFMEATGFPMPIDEVRFSGRLLPDGSVEKGASLMVKLKPRSKLQAFSALSASGDFFARIRKGGLRLIPRMSKTLPASLGFITRGVWQNWGFYNQDHEFVGVGTFRMSPLAGERLAPLPGLKVEKFELEKSRRRLVAEVSGNFKKPNGQQTVLAIILIDTQTGKPVPINYNIALSRETLKNGRTRVTLAIPGSVNLSPGNTRACLLADFQALEQK